MTENPTVSGVPAAPAALDEPDCPDRGAGGHHHPGSPG